VGIRRLKSIFFTTEPPILAKIGGSVVKKIDFKRLIPTGGFWG
jgi:hypothetical protein